MESFYICWNRNDFTVQVGSMFASVGMGKQAVEAYVKSNHIPAAIETCVTLNHWHDAVELAKKYNQPNQISTLLAKYAQHLLEEDKTFQVAILNEHSKKCIIFYSTICSTNIQSV